MNFHLPQPQVKATSFSLLPPVAPDSQGSSFASCKEEGTHPRISPQSTEALQRAVLLRFPPGQEHFEGQLPSQGLAELGTGISLDGLDGGRLCVAGEDPALGLHGFSLFRALLLHLSRTAPLHPVLIFENVSWDESHDVGDEQPGC